MKDIRKPEFMTGISSKGHMAILEILIALVVFYVGSLLSSFIQMPALVVYLLGNRDYQEMIFSGKVNMGKMVDIMLQVPQWMTIVMLVGELGLFAAVFLYCRFLEKRKLNTLGFCKKRWIFSYIRGIVLGLFLFGVAYLICYLSGSITIGTVSFSGNTILYVVGFFLGYLIQGMAEEVLCRGYLLVSLTRRCPVILSVVLSSLFFSMLHGMNEGVTLLAYVNLFLFGVVMALLFIRYENIWIVGAVHSIWNFAQGNLLGVQVSGMKKQPSLIQSNMTEGWEVINGGSFGMEGGLAVTLVLVVALGVIVSSMKKQGYFVEAVSQNAAWGNGNIPPQGTAWGNGNVPPQGISGQNGNPVSGKDDNPLGNDSSQGGYQSTENQIQTPGKTYENMGLNPEETPWYPREKKQENSKSMTGFDQSYFRD